MKSCFDWVCGAAQMSLFAVPMLGMLMDSETAPEAPIKKPPAAPLAPTISALSTPPAPSNWQSVYSLYCRAKNIVAKPYIPVIGNWKFGLFYDSPSKASQVTRLVVVSLASYGAYRMTRSLFSSREPQLVPQIHIKIDIHNNNSGAPVIDVTQATAVEKQ